MSALFNNRVLRENDLILNARESRILNEGLLRDKIFLETNEYIKNISSDRLNTNLTFKELFNNLNLLNDKFLNSLVECRNEKGDINIILRISKSTTTGNFIIYDANGTNVGQKNTYYNYVTLDEILYENVCNIYQIVFKKGEWSREYDKYNGSNLEGGKRKSKGKSKKVAKKPVVSQKKQSIYKEILGKQMKIYKMPDSRKEYVKYKGDLHLITDYKDLMKQKANAKPKAKPKPKK